MTDSTQPGMVLLDKPAGISSFTAISRLRRVFGKRVGHAGTLDPFATGLLLVLVGRATRLVPYLVGADKVYSGSIQFGQRSTTADPDGDLEPTGQTTDAASVHAAMAAFTGLIEQVPPAASAIHIDGERAYRRFRRGETITMPTRQVAVHSFQLMRFDAATQRADVTVSCGSGTYVRSLARDLGEAVGAGAYLANLRRTAVGSFAVQDAIGPDDPALATGGQGWFSPAVAVAHLPQRRINTVDALRVGHGSQLTVAADTAPGPYALLDDDGVLLAIGDCQDGIIAPRVVLETGKC